MAGLIGSVRDHTEALIAFDKLPVAQHLGAAVDQVRPSENRALRQHGDDRLVKTRYLWLTRRGNITQWQRRRFTPRRRSLLRVARAWAIKGSSAESVGRTEGLVVLVRPTACPCARRRQGASLRSAPAARG